MTIRKRTSFSKKFDKPGEDLEDLISIGTIGHHNKLLSYIEMSDIKMVPFYLTQDIYGSTLMSLRLNFRNGTILMSIRRLF